VGAVLGELRTNQNPPPCETEKEEEREQYRDEKYRESQGEGQAVELDDLRKENGPYDAQMAIIQTKPQYLSTYVYKNHI